MSRPIISISKDDQLKNSPGGNRKAKAAKSAKEKGSDFEKTVQAEFQRTSKTKVRRNHQGREGGGLSNPDVAPLYGWHCETKDEDRITLREYLKQLQEDCPKNNRPILVLAVDKKPWLMIRLEDRTHFASDQIEAAGGEVYFR
jgi:hypothetical protein